MGSVWDEISARLAALRMAWIFETKDVRDALTSLTRELAGPKAKSLGWTFNSDDNHIQRQFKSVPPPPPFYHIFFSDFLVHVCNGRSSR
jgi:hypothetical protein